MATMEDWELGSGLPLADATVEITGALFKVDAAYAAGAIVCGITFLNVETGETQEQIYSCGKNWELRDRGASIEGTGKLNNQTMYGRWVAHAFGQCEGNEQLIADLLDRGTYREAAVWVGCKFVLGTVEVTTMNPQTKKEAVKNLIVPVSYLGLADGTTEAAKPAAKTAKPSGTAAKGGGDVDESMVDAIKQAAAKVAAKGGDHAAFFDAALDLAGVATNKAAMKLVKDASAEGIFGLAVTEAAE